MRRNTRIMEVYVELKRSVPLGAFLDFVRAQNFEPSNLQMQLENTSDLDVLAFSVTLKGPKEFSHSDIVQTVRNMDGVSYMEEL